MKPRLYVFAGLFVTVLAVFAMAASVLAAPPAQGQQYATPTPGPDGRIIYIVKAGETCTSISLLTGVPVDYIRTTNRLDENCTLREGQDLMIGIGGPSLPTATPNPKVTPSAVPPTATPQTGGTAQVCVLVYADVNGDALRQETEGAIAGAAISLTSKDGIYSQTLTSVINPDPEAYQGICFLDVPPEKYSVSAAAPDGYNATIDLTTSVEVIPGDTAWVNFGAQARVEPPQTTTTPQGTSPLLGIIGAAFLLVGAGLGAYTWRMLRKK